MTTPIPKTQWWSTLQPLVGEHRDVDVFKDFVILAACALAHPAREDDHARIAAKYTPEEYPLFPRAFGALMFERILDPYTDTLGTTYMALTREDLKQGRGAFYTPQPVAERVAAMTFGQHDPESSEPILLTDPACESGVTLLEAARLAEQQGVLGRLVVEAWGLDYTATQMTYVNLCLAEVKGRVVHGDAQTQTELDRWWTNTRMKKMFAAPVQNVVDYFKEKNT